MSQLAQLRQKIRSIQTTKKITHAVRLVSMSLYNRLDKLDAPLNRYTTVTKDLFFTLLQHAPEWKNSTLFPQDIFDAFPLYIMVASSKGLCGSLNTNLFRYWESSVFIEQQQDPKFIAIGQKAINFLKEKGLAKKIICTYTELSSHNFTAVADDLVNKIITNKVPFSSVSFFSNQQRSFFIQRPRKCTVIPLSLESLQNKTDKENNDHEPVTQVHLEEDLSGSLIWEQGEAEILDHLSSCYLRSTIVYILFQALRAEQAARFLAMESSTNNAEKYLERLTLQFNKLRQGLITRQVSELSSTTPSR